MTDPQAPRKPQTLSEYRRRFKGLPMREYRRRMPPAVFDVFLRFTGCLSAPPDFDVVGACRPECAGSQP